ncbi:amino acid adenylation domain-containing protein [Kitasatospora sp. NPDC002040]|uniref:amino acid adenylation domain-containing protein n=1 Tax=Kitasatospora sp. NPDC002040 TaxID=3154661 RepID=UPI003318A253
MLLSYADGSADLVLVAHRAVLDPTSLGLVGKVLIGELKPNELTLADVESGDEVTCGWRESVSASRVEWARPDPEAGDTSGVVEVELPGGIEGAAARLAVAAGLVLGRYEPGRPAAIALVTGRADRTNRSLGAFGGGSVLAVDMVGSRTAGELLAAAHDALSGVERCVARSHTDACAAIDDAAVVGLLCDALNLDAADVLLAQSGPWPLTLVPRGGPDGELSVEVHHRVWEVDGAIAHDFASQLASVYRQLASVDDDLPADRVEVFDEAEVERQLALGLPAFPMPLWQPQRIDTAFESCAARRPDAIAVVCGGTSLTYRELDQRASRLAAGLVTQGVAPGDRIGVCLDRSTDLVATLLAVLKADAVYVPLDPGHPADRLAHTVEDAGLLLVVTDMDGFPAAAGTRLVSPTELARAAENTTVRPASRRSPEDAAYVIYTSGSTGRPKGVVVPHRNVLALLAATTDDFGLGPDDTWTLFHSSAFDFSVWEMWGALLTGARLVVVEYWVSRSPEEFHALLVDEGVTVLNQTPSAFEQLMEADRRQERALPLRLVLFGGESLDTRVLRGWFDRYPEHRCRLVNMFGITETTVHVTATTITRREAMAGSRSVGRPLSGWYVQVLDERGRPVPAGVAGEIYVGGEGVALGYLGRPELTAERFVERPGAGGRMYRSGDRGRFLPDGRIEHLGRLDNQVKVRGFRIELDEIRTVLLEDPSVTSAAVVLGGTAAGDAACTRIDAHVVLNGQQSVDWTAVLRARAARVLPEYMVPATFTEVSELPLTVNGKLDTRKLLERAVEPTPVTVSAPVASTPAAVEEGDLGAALAEVWESVLGVPVGRDDNFFELGGNSLFAVRARTAMRERGLPELTLRQLYLTPTVRVLTEILGTS